MNHNHYYSVNQYLQNTFGEKIYKISLNGKMSCPNRDGSLGHKGCIFCSEGGSGDFAQSASLSITEQIENGKKRVSKKFSGSKYIAYFQAFTNTYASVSYLEKIFTEAISHPDIVALSIATRPDCLDDEKIALLTRLNNTKPVWIELGLQTIHEDTATFIRRGYSLCTYDNIMEKLVKNNLTTIVHMIIGLPGETKEMIIDTAKYIASSKASGIKLQLLHILKNTDLATCYQNGEISVLNMDEYIDILSSIIPILPKDMVIHRLTGDGPRNLLIAPLWSLDKKRVLNTINRVLKEQQIFQGDKYLP